LVFQNFQSIISNILSSSFFEPTFEAGCHDSIMNDCERSCFFLSPAFERKPIDFYGLRSSRADSFRRLGDWDMRGGQIVAIVQNGHRPSRRKIRSGAVTPISAPAGLV
jgi:hypothetical protein